MYKPFPIPPPGLMKPPTPKMKPGYWYDGNLIRWENGAPKPVGGWEKIANIVTASPIRAIHKWRDLTGIQWTAFLCDAHLYAFNGSTLFDISPTLPLTAPSGDLVAGGYGDGPYGAGAYGTPRPMRPDRRSIGNVFTLDNYGSLLIAMSSVDGRLLKWDPATITTKAVKVANSPTGRMFTVTPERIIIVFGVGTTQRTFRWCDQEDIEDWNMADVASKAGEYDVEPSAPIIAARQTSAGAIFATSKGWYLVRFVGLPFVYSYEPLHTGAVPNTAASVVALHDGAMWPSGTDFYRFDGSTVSPVACDLKSWFSDTLSRNYVRFRPAGVRLDDYGEIWWFFPSVGKTENDTVLIFNYLEGWWSKGCIGRTCGESGDYTGFPYMASIAGVYKHESGTYYPDAADLAWVETGPFNGAPGMMSMVKKVMLDVGRRDAPVVVSFGYEMVSSKSGEVRSPDYTPDGNSEIQPRISGRDFRLRIGTASAAASQWTFGEHLIDMAPRGVRGSR